MPISENSVDEPPPFVVVVQGPPGVGKTTLVRSLVKHYTRYSLNEVKGPITVVSGKSRRIQFIECGQDLNSMVDTAKLADLVLLCVDGDFGFEMETFEYLNILQAKQYNCYMRAILISWHCATQCQLINRNQPRWHAPRPSACPRASERAAQVHGFPKVMGVLTHLDQFKDPKKLRKTKKTLKARLPATPAPLRPPRTL